MGDILDMKTAKRRPLCTESDLFGQVAAMIRRRTVSVKRHRSVELLFETDAEADTFEELLRQLGKIRRD